MALPARRPRHPRLPRTLLRASVALSVAGTALAAGVGAAAAADLAGAVTRAADPGTVAGAVAKTPLNSPTRTVSGPLGVLGDTVTTAAREGVGPITKLRLDPLAGTTTDPLTNSVGTRVADFKPVGTRLVTDPLTRGGGLADLPVVHEAGGLLGGK
ncbi:hypothetical protein ACFV3R_08310 [Streptomyces sp. NPDC059740]|uniref:hypothetical protein n=1 Tax=Streptomyces sp. NPDC059740 TaxID=3346926 RepID=UPI003667FBB6